MPKTRRKRRTPKRVLALPDLEQSKAAVLNNLTSESGQRTYDRAITSALAGNDPGLLAIRNCHKISRTF